MASRSQRIEVTQDVARENAILALEDLGTIKSLGKRELLDLQASLGFGSSWGELHVPRHFMPAGNAQKRSRREIDLKVAGASEEDLVSLMRLVWLRWLVPIGRNSRPCTASTFGQEVKSLRKLYRYALSKPVPRPYRLWARITQDEAYEVVPRTSRKNIARVFETLSGLGLTDDTIVIRPKRRPDLRERVRRGEPAPDSDLEQTEPYRPLSDEFVGQMGWRCAWFIRNVGPSLLEALEKVYRDHSPRNDLTPEVARQKFRQESQSTVAMHVWLDEESVEIKSPPFDISLITQGGRVAGERAKQMAWPPTTLPDLWQLAQVLQSAHAFVVGLSGGPREGEVLSQTKSLVVEAPGGTRILGRTYKLEFEEQGRIRDWPAPRMTVISVVQQARLAEIAQRAAAAFGFDNSGPQLWVMLQNKDLSRSGLQLNGLEYGFKKLVNVFGMQDLLGKGDRRERILHSHRLRKTTGRLVGLSLTNAVQVLMDLFGHQDPEMTIAYLLSNKDIAREAQEVAKAQTIIFATEAISSHNSNSGPAASMISGKVAEFARIRGVSKLDAQSIDELARDLTELGTYWELVRPGVICTKLPGEAGACSPGVGTSDPSRCQSTCARRLELASEKVSVDRTIEQAVVHLAKAINAKEFMLEHHWRGQIAANLWFFSHLRGVAHGRPVRFVGV